MQRRKEALWPIGGTGAPIATNDSNRSPGTRLESLRAPLRYLSYAAFIIVAGVLALVAVATAPVLFGYHTYVIDGGSMEPTISNGSVAVTHPTSPRAIGVGDIIAYRSSPRNEPVLHRVTAVGEDADGNRVFTTQGDANGTADPIPVALAGSGDKMVYSVPYAGYILGFAGTTPGRLAFIGVPLLLLCAGFVWEKVRAVPMRRGRVNEQERQKLLAMLVPRDVPVASPETAELPEPEMSFASAELPEPETPFASAELPEPEMSFASAKLPEPEISLEAAELPEPEISLEAADLPEPETPFAAAELPEPETPFAAAELPESEMSFAAAETPTLAESPPLAIERGAREDQGLPGFLLRQLAELAQTSGAEDERGNAVAA